MTQINDNTVQKFFLLNQKLQKIQKKVKTEKITSKAKVSLNKELEDLQESIETLQHQAMDAQQHVKSLFSQLEEMNGEIISLYGEIEDQFEKYEISLISKEALSLGNSLESSAMTKVASKVSELKHNIHFLFKHRRPSLQHRKIINLALKLVDEANEIIEEKGQNLGKHLHMIQLLKKLLQEALQRAGQFIDPYEAELAMELYEVADLFNKRKKNEGLMRLNFLRTQLSKAQQRRLDAASSPEEIIQALLDIAEGDSCQSWKQNKEPYLTLVSQA